MTKPMRCAAGLTVHTGWAACVLVAGSVTTPQVLERRRVVLIPSTDRFVYHRAALDPANAKRIVAQARKEADVAARSALPALVAQAREAGAELAACAVVASTGPLPDRLEEILAAHPRLHAAEGALFRDALARAAERCGLRVRITTPRDAAALQPAETVSAIGAQVGRPWGKDQRLAALAAWALLAGRGKR